VKAGAGRQAKRDALDGPSEANPVIEAQPRRRPSQHPPGHHSESAYQNDAGYRNVNARKKSTPSSGDKVADDERDGKRGHGVPMENENRSGGAFDSSEADLARPRPLLSSSAL